MADALKAEGNKAFSAKDYPTAMYVLLPRLCDELMTGSREVANEIFDFH